MSDEFNYLASKVDRQIDHAQRKSLLWIEEAKEVTRRKAEDYIPAEPDPFEKDKSFASVIGAFHRQPQRIVSNGIKSLR